MFFFKLLTFSYPSVLTYISSVHKNHLIETIILSTRNWVENKENLCLIMHHYLEYLCNKKYYFFLTKTYVVGTQKNHLNKMVLLSTPNIC